MKGEGKRGGKAYKCKVISTHKRCQREMFTYAKTLCAHTFILRRAQRKQKMENKLGQVQSSINSLSSLKRYHIYSLSLMGTLRRIEMHHIYDLYAYGDVEYRKAEKERLFHLSYLLFLVNRAGQLRFQKI